MIGVFDSGLGGLTVLKALLAEMPKQSFVYLGDTARLPYGTKSPETIHKYTQQNLKFLKNQPGVEALVIACNSASAHWTESHFEGLPVFTVIEPASSAAVKITQNNKVGLLATRATVAAKAFDQVIAKLNPEAQLFSQSAPLLVPLAEEGLIADPLTNLIVYRYVQPLIQQGVDTIILGCTHYPILKQSLQKAAGPDVQLVESGFSLSQIIKSSHFAQKIDNPEVHIFTTDALGHFRKWAEEILSPFQANHWQLTDLT